MNLKFLLVFIKQKTLYVRVPTPPLCSRIWHMVEVYLIGIEELHFVTQ